jgi:hypothetical protein
MSKKLHMPAVRIFIHGPVQPLGTYYANHPRDCAGDLPHEHTEYIRADAVEALRVSAERYMIRGHDAACSSQSCVCGYEDVRGALHNLEGP